MNGIAPLNEQMDEIRRGTVEVLPEDDLARKVERSVRTQQPLRVKQGFDPTRPALHIGHLIPIRKLRTLQQLGHEIHFVVGDFTARVGDPSGRSEPRPRLTPEEVAGNAAAWTSQIAHILDVSTVCVQHNSQWLAPLSLSHFLEISAAYTVEQMLERKDFAQRHADGPPIRILELLYPLLQAYDSVALSADIEVGGADQKANLLVGRAVQEAYGQEPQVCLIMPLLPGTDGAEKMSKSLDNTIGITESAASQYQRTMELPDTLLENWIRLATSLEGDELEAALRLAASDPAAAKRTLAHHIVASYHGETAAAAAASDFEGGAPGR